MLVRPVHWTRNPEIQMLRLHLATAVILLGGLGYSNGMEGTAEKRPEPEASAPDGFVRLRPPLLGFAIERAPTGGRHRLVTVPGQGPEAKGGEVILEGTLEAC